MTDISAIGTVVTISNDGLSKVTFNDIGDNGSAIEFGAINPVGHEFDLNHKMVAWHNLVTPEISLSFIPGSPSDRRMRALLLSSIMGDSSFNTVSDIQVSRLSVKIPKRNGRTEQEFVFSEGYLVGGSTGLSISSEGRLVSSPYKFVFKNCWTADTALCGFEKLSDSFTETKLYANDSEIEGIYYARISEVSSARMISHPIETGGVIFDHKYLEPKRLSVRVKVPITILRTVSSQFKAMIADRKLKTGSSEMTPYRIVSKSDEFTNLMLIRFTTEETPDRFDLVECSLEFQELLFTSTKGQTTTFDPANYAGKGTQAKNTSSTRPTT